MVPAPCHLYTITRQERSIDSVCLDGSCTIWYTRQSGPRAYSAQVRKGFVEAGRYRQRRDCRSKAEWCIGRRHGSGLCSHRVSPFSTTFTHLATHSLILIASHPCSVILLLLERTTKRSKRRSKQVSSRVRRGKRRFLRRWRLNRRL